MGRRAQATTAFEDPYSLPVYSRAITFPELTHGETELLWDSTLGYLVGPRQSIAGDSSNSPSLIERLGLEVPLLGRRWFVGGTYVLSATTSPSRNGEFQLLGGNFQITARGVWARRTGLAFGGGLGLVVPTSISVLGKDPASAGSKAETICIWDTPLFLSGYTSVRPFMDVRAVDGPFVIQFRQGLDISHPIDNRRPVLLSAVAGIHIGSKLGDLATIGLEAIEYYVLRGNVEDDRRFHLTVAPILRFLFSSFQPALSLYYGFGNPFQVGEQPREGTVGIRLAVSVLLE